MSTAVEAWANILEYIADGHGPSLGTVVQHLRDAIAEAGFCTRTRLTIGLKEAYQPFDIASEVLRDRIEKALQLLLRTGDIDEFETASGRAYAPSPPRRVTWGGTMVTILGAVVTRANSDAVRRMAVGAGSTAAAVEIPLHEELGLPDWRTALVQLGGVDAPDCDPRTLFSLACALAAGGERFALEPRGAIAVVARRGDFFGRAEPVPSGRWTGAESDGVFPARISVGYQRRDVVLDIRGGQATVWQPSSRDLWRWIVIGATLAQGDPVLRYDAVARTLTFLTPPARQLQRAALLTGVQTGPWTWELDTNAFEVIQTFLKPQRDLGEATPTLI